MSTIYLYIKQHKNTKLLYFGKTTQKNPEKYLGSGKHWTRHIKKHGKLIDTICVWEFENQEECTNFALKFSQENNIEKCDKWANLMYENGIQGRVLGLKHSNETKQKMSYTRKGKSQKGNPWSEKTREKFRQTKKDNPQIFTTETREKISKSKKGILHSENHKKNVSLSKIGNKSNSGKKWYYDNINMKAVTCFPEQKLYYYTKGRTPPIIS